MIKLSHHQKEEITVTIKTINLDEKLEVPLFYQGSNQRRESMTSKKDRAPRTDGHFESLRMEMV